MAYQKLTQHSLTNDMSKQGFVPQGRVAAPPGVNSQNMFTPTQNLRGQPQNYFTNASPNVQTPRSYPLTSARPQTMPLIYGLTGQTTGQAYTASPGTPVIMNANPVMTYPSAQQRIQTPPFTNQPQQSVQQFQMATAASPQYYPQTPPTTNPVYYQQAQPFVSPQRPPSAAAVQNTPSYQRRQRTIIQIVDPNTGKDISEEILNNRSTADGSLSGSQISGDVRAQFAAQVAATLKTGPVSLQFQLPMQQVQNVPPAVQQQPSMQQQVQQLTPQQIQSHPVVAQAPQVPHTPATAPQVHQLTSVQQQPAPSPPPQQPGLSHAPISHISPRPVTPQSQPQPQRRQPSKSPPAAIGNIPAPVQNMKETSCIVFQTGKPQNQELMATQSHALSSPLSLQETLSIRPSSPVQNKAPQIAPSQPTTSSMQTSQLPTPVVPQLTTTVVPPLAAVVPGLATPVVRQLMPSPVVQPQTEQPVVVPQLTQPVPASQPLTVPPALIQVPQVAPKQPPQQVSQPSAQLTSPQTIPPVTPVTQQQPSMQASQAIPMQVSQAIPMQASQAIPMQVSHIQQQQQQQALPQQASQQKSTVPEVPVSNAPAQVTTQVQNKPSSSPSVEVATDSAGCTDSAVIPTASTFVVEENNGDDKAQESTDLKEEISSLRPTSPSPPPPTSQASAFEKPVENQGDRLSPKSTKPEIETEQKPVTDDKDSVQVSSPLENSKVNEDNAAKDIKKDKPKKKKEEITKKGKSKEELETETMKDSQPSSVDEATKEDLEESAPPNDLAAKEEKSAIDEEDITKVEIKIEDKIVAKENEKNEAKNNEEEEESIDDCEDNSLKCKYKDDQWSPHNPDGKKQYDRDFLLDLQFSNESLSKPCGLPDLPDVILMKPHTQEVIRTFEKTGIHQSPSYDFTPGYVKSSKAFCVLQPSSSGGSMTKRGSQQGSGRKEIKKIMNVCISSDLPLNKCENAWKPSYKITKETEDEELNRRVRSILNKLTPQKFHILLTQMRSIQIDTENKLKVVIDLLFEKAISEPNFSVAYANLCNYLSLLKVPSITKPGDDVNFRKLLITRCQEEFEEIIAEEATLNKKKQEIKNAKNEEQKKRLTELEEEFSAAKRRSVGNIRFIGELFKLKMLTENIMHECLFKLLRSKDEESLECLCRLLKTVGKELDLEVAKPRMDQYFQQMKKIVSERKTSSRVRFMLQDVMELRECKWKPRRAENNPKTIEQIHAEAAQEEKEKKIMLENAAAQQRTIHHRPGGNNGGSRSTQGQRGSVGPIDDGGWNTVASKQIRIPFDSNKLRLPKQQKIDNVQLGPGGGNWGRGSSGGGLKGSQESERSPGNRFSALSGPAEEGRGRYGRGGVSPARGDVMTRPYSFSSTNNSTRGKIMSRSSQEGDKERMIGHSRNMHSSSGRATPPSRGPSRESSRSRDVRHKEEAAEQPTPPVKELSIDEINHKTVAIMDEYLHITDIKEATQCVIEIKNQPYLYCFVSKALEYVLERSQVSRRQTGLLLHNLVKAEIIDVETYLKGLNEILEFADDMAIDIPMIWTYLGELLGVMVNDKCVPLGFLKEACKPLKRTDKAKILVAEILHNASHQLGHRKVSELWRSSGLKWSDFIIEPEDEAEFIKEKKLEFTLSVDAPQPNPETISIEKLKEKLNNLLLTPEAKNEEIFDWIDANVPEEMTKQSPFVRTLMTAVCLSAISGLESTAKVEEQLIKERSKLLQKYLINQTLQLQALYALQALDHQMEHPQSVLRSIFNFLFDEDVISEEAFKKWAKSDDPAEQEGKGVALKQVVQFFTSLENYNDDS